VTPYTADVGVAYCISLYSTNNAVTSGISGEIRGERYTKVFKAFHFIVADQTIQH